MFRNRIWHAFFVLLILACFTQLSTAQEWSDQITISNDGSSPDLDIDPVTKHLHIVSMGGTKGVYYSELDATGNVIISEEAVPDATGDVSKMRFGAAIAVDTDGTPYICYRDEKGSTYIFSGFLTYRTASGWSNSQKVYGNMERGYSVRMDIDENNNIQLIHGESVESEYGRIYHYLIDNGNVDLRLKTSGSSSAKNYRGDDRVEVSTGPDNTVHLLASCPRSSNAPVNYWRSTDGGYTWSGKADLHHDDATGRNGNADLFVSKNGHVHVCYGASKDRSRGGDRSLRYTKLVNGIKVIDVAVTDRGELQDWHHEGLGIGSVAASDDGQYVVIAYTTTSGGQLRTRLSEDGGETWSEPTELASSSGGDEGREKHVVRAEGYSFYLLYPTSNRKVYLRILNVQPPEPPVANAGGPYTGDEGSPITFDGSQSTDATGITTYEWDWDNDGVYDISTASPTAQHTFVDDYSGQVALRCTNGFGLKSQDVTNVTVNNVNPVANAGDDTTGDEGSDISFTATVTDPGTEDTHTYLWNFNDGSDPVAGPTVNHAFIDNGTYNVILTITDDDNGVSTDNVSVTVQNVAPVAEAGGPYQGEINQQIQLTGTATDAGQNDTHTYEWDLDNDDSYETSGDNVLASFPNTGAYVVKLRVTDNDGASSIDNATITVSNNAPSISSIPNKTIQEGETFPTITLDDFVSDPNNSASQLSWSYHGESDLLVTIESRILTVTTPNSDWCGSETITLVVTDPTQLQDSIAVIFTATPINDPPVISALPDTSFADEDSLIFTYSFLSQFVTDIDNESTDLTFEIKENVNLTKLKDNLGRKISIYLGTPGWTGTETIKLRVIDSDGASDEEPWQITVVKNQVPLDSVKVDNIPEQSVQIGESFTAINLDDYVTDLDYNDSQINWTVDGNVNLSVDINENRVATITSNNPGWYGSENITFTATNPRSITDNTTTKFTIRPNNIAPQLGQVPDVSFTEDGSQSVLLSELNQWVSDPDSDPETFTYNIINNDNISWYLDLPQKTLNLTAKPNWYGEEIVTLIVSDDYGSSDSTDWKIVVYELPDAPTEFSLIYPFVITFWEWPDTVEFRWEPSVDVDTGSKIKYHWILSSDETFNDDSKTLSELSDITDSTVVFAPKNLYIEKGTYYWQVIAISSNGRFTKCVENGTIITAHSTMVDIKDTDGANIPGDFALMQNHPNPFSASGGNTQITYHLNKSSNVQLTIYNTLGQEVRKLVVSLKEPGVHTLSWNGRDNYGNLVAGGIYICRMRANSKVFTRKILVIP